MKIQRKIVLVLLTLFISYALIFSGFIYFSISRYAFQDFYKRLEIRAIAEAKSKLEKHSGGEAISDLREEYLETLNNEHIDIILLVGNSSLEDSLTTTLKYPANFISTLLADRAITTYNQKEKFYYGTLYTPNDSKDSYLLIISADNYFYNHHISYLRNVIIGGLLVAFFIILGTTLLLTKKITEPIQNIITQVKSISTENLHLRLATRKDNDDLIHHLTETFNGMLVRLEAAFETQKNFISNASHELNTPLTTIIGEADVALSKQRTSQEYVDALKTILAQAENLNQKTKALMTLAQTGYNGKTQKFEVKRIDELLSDVKDTVEQINSKNKIVFDFTLLPDNPELLMMMANESLLHIALSNLMINGCKYSNYQPVQVALGVSNNHILIAIRDKGIGIPKTEMPFIYDPYFRASNTSQHDGYGIGLPLARNIIKMHNGTLEVSSIENQGTVVEVVLPMLKSAN